MENDRGPLEKLLILAVPEWIERLKHKSFSDFEGRRDAILESVCYKGDLLLYGSKKKGETAQLFNDLAEGLAWLALIAKGGVTFGDLHWDAEFADVPDLPETDQGSSESKAMRTMCGDASPSAGVNTNSGADSAGQELDREKARD